MFNFLKRKKEEPNSTPNDLPSDRPKSMEQIAQEQIEEGQEEYKRSNRGLFLSAFIAGMDLGFSLLIMAVLYTMFSEKSSEETMQLIMAAAYPVGFLFVVLGRSALFTEHTTLAVFPVLDGQQPLRALARIWGLIYAGNILGGYLIGTMIVWLGPKLNILTHHSLEEIALHLMEIEGIAIVGSGLLAGWLMGLLSWLVTSSQETISRIFIVFLITGAIGIGSLHHCIVGSTEMFAGMIVSEKIGILDYLSTQFFSSLGNIIGGVFFVSVLKFQAIQS
ncbi:MAG: formate/nitrite transporter family protein [Saprospiraceae bacterium]|nr:formate/nitrite transporter family protein [Saprospiraceae bacterium]